MYIVNNKSILKEVFTEEDIGHQNMFSPFLFWKQDSFYSVANMSKLSEIKSCSKNKNSI